METQSEETKMALIQSDVAYIKATLGKIERALEMIMGNYLSKVEFDLFKNGEWWTVKMLVYGTVGTVLAAVIAFLLHGGKL